LPIGLRHEIEKTFEDCDCIRVPYDLNFTKQTMTLFRFGWYRVDDGKVDSIKEFLTQARFAARKNEL